MRASIKSCPRVVVVLCIQLIACTGGLNAKGERPNILWITSEDNSADWVGAYGNPHADTPHIDQLAAEGFQYMHTYANVPVCAPQRSTWITGMLAISTGTFPMRSRHEIPHDRVPYYPDQLQAAGYFTANATKNDFNIGGREDEEVWDRQGEVDWDLIEQRQPFFQIINIGYSHEGRVHREVENVAHDPADVRLREYHPDLPEIRSDYAKYHDAVKRMDSEVGVVLAKLETMGLAENTIVIHNSDHGGVLPRSKRYLFSSGLHCPLIVRIPQRYQALWPAEQPGTQIDRLVSFVDMPKTWLSLTGAEVPGTMQGSIFLGPHTEPEPEYHFAFRGRMDERLDSARALTDKRYLYIRNYMPYVPWMQELEYLWRSKATQAWDAHVQSGEAAEVHARFFSPKGWSEELYDLQKDPDNVVNLANRPDYAETVARFRGTMRSTQLRYHDAGLLPESEMIRRAAENDLTIFEMVRDPNLYNLPALLDAADLALERNPDHLPALEQLLESPDSGLRYWGITGCFLLESKPAQIDTLLQDDSHEVRLMAAWLLIRTGEKEQGFQALEGVLRENDYAMLTAMNMIDWIGEEARPLLESLPAEAALGSYEQRMLGVLQSRFNQK